MATTTPAPEVSPSQLATQSTSPATLPTPDRLSLPFDRRILLATFASFTCGSILGYTNTSRLAALRFRAENAHRLPISQPGWYLYHKSKNYYRLRYGIAAGLRSGVYVAAWSGVFFVLEESMDIFRGTWQAGRSLQGMEGVSELDIEGVDRGVEKSRDFWSSTMAGLVTGGVWARWHHFGRETMARTIFIGLMAGLGYGLGQDALTWARERMGGVNEVESWITRGAKNKGTIPQEEQDSKTGK